jgi:DNA-binding IclR family transcriptional regulator
LNSESVGALARPPVAASSRSLSTARSVLRVLTLLVQRPGGVRADEVAEELGKSVSTAYYLLTSLCEEGFAVHARKGVYRPARGLEQLTAVAEHLNDGHLVHQGLAASVDDLFLLTRKRSYLGVVHSGKIEIVAFRGRQGVPRMPGLGSEIRDSAHALAMGKVVLSLLGPEAVALYIARGLKRFTQHTITSGGALIAELDRARRDGFAVDREEFDENFCCVAAPILDDHGQFVAALGLSTSVHIFDTEREQLAATVVEVAKRSKKLQADAKNTSFLPLSASKPRLVRLPPRGTKAARARGNQTRSNG